MDDTITDLGDACSASTSQPERREERCLAAFGDIRRRDREAAQARSDRCASGHRVRADRRRIGSEATMHEHPALGAAALRSWRPRSAPGKLSPVALTRGCARSHRNARWQAAKLHPCLAAMRCDQARRPSARSSAGRLARTAARHSGGGQGQLPDRGHADARAGTVRAGIAFPRRDSAAAARLRDAGAVLIGKTRTHEFAWGNVTPPSRNPWDLTRVPSRIERRIRRRRGGAAVRGGAGLRHRRIDPHAGRRVRHGRAEGRPSAA